MGKSTISMAMFNSYFDITRGYLLKKPAIGAGQNERASQHGALQALMSA